MDEGSSRGTSITVTNLRPAAGDVDTRFVRRNSHAERLRSVALQLIQRHFDRLAHVRAKHS
jgi:hypothetical protein